MLSVTSTYIYPHRGEALVARDRIVIQVNDNVEFDFAIADTGYFVDPLSRQQSTALIIYLFSYTRQLKRFAEDLKVRTLTIFARCHYPKKVRTLRLLFWQS